MRVLDLDRPWEAYVVTDSLSGISNLVWDRTGHRLLVTGLDGSCSVWEMEVIYSLSKLKKKNVCMKDQSHVLTIFSWYSPKFQILNCYNGGTHQNLQKCLLNSSK